MIILNVNVDWEFKNLDDFNYILLIRIICLVEEIGVNFVNFLMIFKIIFFINLMINIMYLFLLFILIYLNIKIIILW